MDRPLFLLKDGSNLVSTSTGGIYLEINNVQNSSEGTLQNFDISTSTGSIRANIDYGIPCGEKLDLRVTTGSVETDANRYIVSEATNKKFLGSNEYYMASNINFEYTMSTSTGSIIIN